MRGVLFFAVGALFFAAVFLEKKSFYINLYFASHYLDRDRNKNSNGSSQPRNSLGPVVQRVDNAIQRISHYPKDNCQENVLRYPPASHLSSG